MKIRRYHCPLTGEIYKFHAYAYIWANFFERRAIDKLIAAGKTNIRRHPHGTSDFIITPKREMYEQQ